MKRILSLLLVCFPLFASGAAFAQSADWRALMQEATAQYFQGRFASGTEVAKKALEAAEAANGPRHPGVAAALNRLAEFYRVQGRAAEAEPLYRRALEIRERARGPQSPEVAQSLNNLAQLYSMQARYA